MKTAIYVRVSTVHQTDKDSLPMQRQQLTAYAENILHTDYEIFEDAGFSGKNTERPAFQSMMSRIKLKEFSHVLVWKIDRISRNLIDFATMYDDFKRLGVVFVSLNEQFDTSSAMGGAMLKIILVFAELERNMTSERVTSVMVNKASQGQWNGGKVPYGYAYNKALKRFKIDDKEATVVRMIYSTYLSQGSLVYTAKTLNDKGLRTRQGKMWTAATIGKMLKSPFYVGDYRYNYSAEPKGGSHTAIKREASEWIMSENHHEAIVPREIQTKVISLLDSHKTTSVTRKRKQTHIFAGLVYCGHCGGLMQAQKGRKVNGYVVSEYSCVNHKHGACPNKFCRDVDFAPFVLNYIAHMTRAFNYAKNSTLEQFQAKMLHGKAFKDVKDVEPWDMLITYELAKEEPDAKHAYDYENALFSASLDSKDEISLLTSEKRKIERSMGKLLDLYTSTDSLTKQDYSDKYKALQEALEKVNARLSYIQPKDETQSPQFKSAAAYFVLSQALLYDDYLDFSKLLQSVDVETFRNLITKVCSRIVLKDGHVTSIEFNSGISQQFYY